MKIEGISAFLPTWLLFQTSFSLVLCVRPTLNNGYPLAEITIDLINFQPHTAKNKRKANSRIFVTSSCVSLVGFSSAKAGGLQLNDILIRKNNFSHYGNFKIMMALF